MKRILKTYITQRFIFRCAQTMDQVPEAIVTVVTRKENAADPKTDGGKYYK